MNTPEGNRSEHSSLPAPDNKPDIVTRIELNGPAADMMEEKLGNIAHKFKVATAPSKVNPNNRSLKVDAYTDWEKIDRQEDKRIAQAVKRREERYDSVKDYELERKPDKVFVQQQERPLSVRVKRANILKDEKLRENLRRERRPLLNELQTLDGNDPQSQKRKQELRKKLQELRENAFLPAHELDRLTSEYLVQHEITVHNDKWGDVGTRFVRLTPPESSLNEENRDLPPIVFLPTFTGGPDAMIKLLIDIARSGREVYCISNPEDFPIGKLTPEFVEAVKNSQMFDAHAEFFKQVIDQAIPQGDFELWGFSTGATITQQMLHDEEFNKRVSNAVSISPASSKEKSKTRLLIDTGLVGIRMAIKERLNSLLYNFTYGDKRGLVSEQQKEMREKVTSALMKRIGTVHDFLPAIHLRSGAQLTVVSFNNDYTTSSFEKYKKMSKQQPQNPQVNILNLEGSHYTPTIHMDWVMDKINEHRKEMALTA